MSGRLRLGQTSVVLFVSKILASVLGFAATVYIARLLGADTLGTYSLAVTVVSWLGLLGTMGVTGGIKKRISEQKDPAAYAAAGVALMSSLFVIVSAGVVLFRDQINGYVGHPIAGYVVAMLGVLLAASAISATLNGQHLVHIAGVLSPVHQGSRAGLQIAALAAGLGLAGLLGGYVVGYLIYIVAGGVIAVRSFDTLRLPGRKHFQRILSFAKFAWLGTLRNQAFNWVDIALLGAFVPTSLVGYYTAAWNIAQFLAIFGAAISQTLFPKMSENAAAEEPEAVADLLHTALSFAGLIMIPGLVGSTLLGSRLLTVYGSDFARAGVVLAVLVAAVMLQSYQKQLTTTLNALDRPDTAFRVNFVFIAVNVVLNVAFIVAYGWVGAAVATAASVGLSLVLAYYYVNSLIQFRVPTGEIAKQWGAAGIMALILVVLLQIESAYLTAVSDVAVGLVLVVAGAALYFSALLVLSARFRLTVRDNIPDWMTSFVSN